jgi:hypothetical protein
MHIRVRMHVIQNATFDEHRPNPQCTMSGDSIRLVICSTPMIPMSETAICNSKMPV